LKWIFLTEDETGEKFRCGICRKVIRRLALKQLAMVERIVAEISTTLQRNEVLNLEKVKGCSN